MEYSVLESEAKGIEMIRIDAYFLYQVGAAIRPLTGITSDTTKDAARTRIWVASHWLDNFLNKSVYRLQTCRPKGIELLSTLQKIHSEYAVEGVDVSQPLNFLDHYFLTSQASAFETVLAAELQWGQLYIVSPKGGFDLFQLTENGISIFPDDLATKASETIPDAKEAARCIAFELPTAAAFHLHRVNELVMHRYYDLVTKGKPRPASRTIGAYIDALKNHQAGDKVVYSALASLKDLHRNPVIHPEQRLDSIEDALALYGSIRAVVGYMLKALPPPELQLLPSPNTGEV